MIGNGSKPFPNEHTNTGRVPQFHLTMCK
ncbi:Uncharacterized protein APZ42_025744 [Daphnia magna]|uniref:Uncharacterized protein n=1 Tax=Daphnia magna TaxID=35525 RepID=A0A164ST44_9CRUS|nr:Uncharacterized protein APZ42_025744 [Daphnia magna]